MNYCTKKKGESALQEYFLILKSIKNRFCLEGLFSNPIQKPMLSRNSLGNINFCGWVISTNSQFKNECL